MISIVTWISNNNVRQILSYFCKASQCISMAEMEFHQTRN